MAVVIRQSFVVANIVSGAVGRRKSAFLRMGKIWHLGRALPKPAAACAAIAEMS